MSHETTPKPEALEEHHLLFLDDLRASGKVNMFGASKHIQDAFVLPSRQTTEILSYWMRTYADRHPKG